jgi:1,4-dihydroxy-2-naphthoate octaprenyltransferase
MLLMARSLMLDLLDIQGDAFVGRETLPTLLGTAAGRSLLHLCLLLAAILPLAGSVFLDLEASAAAFSVAPLALVAVSIWLRMQRFASEVAVRLFVDGGLFLAGLAPLVLWMTSRVR